MRACLIRGQGIDLQGFNQMQYCMQSLGSFHCIPPRASFVKLADWYAMVLLAENCLFAQNSEMEVRTFVRIQRVIWDHLSVMLFVLFFVSFSFLVRRGNVLV